MTETNFSKCIEEWLRRDSHGFLLHPEAGRLRLGDTLVSHKNLTGWLSFALSNNGQAIAFAHDDRGRYWDMLAEWSVFPQKAPDGTFFCSECQCFKDHDETENSAADCYETPEALWTAHVADEIMAWIQGFKPNTYLCLYGCADGTENEAYWDEKHGGCGAAILTLDEAKKYDHFHTLCKITKAT